MLSNLQRPNRFSFKLLLPLILFTFVPQFPVLHSLCKKGALKKSIFILLFLVPLISLSAEESKTPFSFEIKAPPLILTNVDFALEVAAKDSLGQVIDLFSGKVDIKGVELRAGRDGVIEIPPFVNGKLDLKNAFISESGSRQISISDGQVSAFITVRVMPGILSILPPLIAIILALVIRQVVLSLFAGIYIGAFLLFDYDIFGGIFRALDHFIIKSISETSHIQIIVFSMLFGGMVGVISKNGGTIGIAKLITRYAKTAKQGQISAWAMSFVMFFDDYANVLVRGNLLRPITDQLKISREKLAFIVDAGAATVASIFLISTWIGYEVGLIDQGLKLINWEEDAYSVFLQTIPFRFYPIFTLIFVFLVAYTGRDFGPMLHAERRARTKGEVLRKGSHPATDLTETTASFSNDKPARWFNGLLPILAILVVGLYGLYSTGTQALKEAGVDSYGIGDIISKSDSYSSLLWASFTGCIVAIVLSVGQRILKVVEALDAWFNGLKSMLLAMLILVLAWSIGAVTQELNTAGYLVQILRGTISPQWLPVLTFLIAALVSFATGTSWGTMAIMMPLVIPLAHTLGLDAGLSFANLEIILHGVISSVLAGAVFGDHCSPISDTTILSSMASACDHIDHVRTQLPYAILAAVVGMFVGDIPTAYGLSPWISLPVGTMVMIGILMLIGKKVE